MDATTVWRFQRFNLIMYFALSSPFPPPLNLLQFAYSGLCTMLRQLFRAIVKPILSKSGFESFESARGIECMECEDQSSTFFWLRCSQLYLEKLRLRTDAKSFDSDQTSMFPVLPLHSNRFASQVSREMAADDSQNNMREIERALYHMEVLGDENAAKNFIEKVKWLIRK